MGAALSVGVVSRPRRPAPPRENGRRRRCDRRARGARRSLAAVPAVLERGSSHREPPRPRRGGSTTGPLVGDAPGTQPPVTRRAADRPGVAQQGRSSAAADGDATRRPQACRPLAPDRGHHDRGARWLTARRDRELHDGTRGGPRPCPALPAQDLGCTACRPPGWRGATAHQHRARREALVKGRRLLLRWIVTVLAVLCGAGWVVAQTISLSTLGATADAQ